jgi:hypothetical protein
MNDLNSMNDPDVSELLKDRQAEAINATLADAFRKDPESEAKNNRIAAEAGVPAMNLLSPDYEESVQKILLKKTNSRDLVTTHPMTSRALANEKFAGVAHDDIDNIKAFEDALSLIGKPRDTLFEKATDAVGALYSAGVQGVAGMPLQGAGAYLKAQGEYLQGDRRIPAYYNPIGVAGGAVLKSVGTVLDAAGYAITKGAETFNDKERVGTSWDVIRGVGQVGGQIMAAVINPALATGAMFGQGMQQQRERLDAAGVTNNETKIKSMLLGGAVTGITEKVELGVIMKGIPGLDTIYDILPDSIKNKYTQKLIDVGGAAGAEALQETIENLSQDVVEYGFYNQDVEFGKDLAEAAQVGGIVGGIARTFVLGITHGARVLERRQQSEDVTVAAQKMKVAERDPQAVKEMMEAHNPGAQVYVDGDVARTYYQGLDEQSRAALDQAIPDLKTRLAESELSGTDVTLPRSDYVAYIAAYDKGKLLVDHVKFELDDLTVAQITDPDFMRGYLGLEDQIDARKSEVEQLQERLMDEAVKSGRFGVRESARASIAPITGFFRTLAERGANEGFLRDVMNGISLQGPAPMRRAFVDVQDKMINDMREYEVYTDRAVRNKENAYKRAVERARIKSQETGQAYKAPKIKKETKGFYPVLRYLAKKGGVKSKGPMASELRNMDITPSKFPWLFDNAKGRETWDNVVQSEMADEFRDYGVNIPDSDGTGYVPIDWLYDQISNEVAGKPFIPPPTDVMSEQFDQFMQHLDALGVDLQTSSNDEIKAALAEPIDYQSDKISDAEIQVDNAIVYNQKAETGTKEFKKWFKNSKVVDENGDPLVVYHGSGAQIDAFDFAFTGKGNDQVGSGFYFTTDFSEADSYKERTVNEKPKLGGNDNPNVYSVYLSIQNPLDSDKIGSVSAKQIRKMLSYAPKDSLKNGLENWGDPEMMSQSQILNEAVPNYVIENENIVQRLFNLANDFFGSSPEGVKGFNTAMRDVLGYDGVSVQFDGTDKKHYVAFFPEQIKSVNNRGTFDPNDANILNQLNRGNIVINRDGTYVINLMGDSNLSTLLHESGHLFFDIYARVAERADTPQQIKDDFQKMLDYLEVPSYQDVDVEHHEKIARAFETYLMTGESPSVGMREYFLKFKNWLVHIYETALALKAPVTPELKGVFDRMLATDQEIEQVSWDKSFAIDNDLMSILNKEEQEKYQKIQDRAFREANEDLLKTALRQEERKTKAWWKEERAKLRDQIMQETQRDPIYRALKFFKTGEFYEGDTWNPIPAAKIRRSDAEKILGKTNMKMLPSSFFSKDGVSADMLSEFLGYQVHGNEGMRGGTGKEFLYALVNANEINAHVDRVTDETMIDRHGDILNDGTMHEKAIEKFHNDAQAAKIEFEGKQAAKLAKVKFGSSTNFEEAARRILGEKLVQDAGAADKYYRGALRAARAYGKAVKGKDWIAAVKAKQQQMLSHYMYKQSLEARKTTEKSVESWKRLRQGDEKLSKTMDMNYVYAARVILSKYGVLNFNDQNIGTYIKNLERDDPEGYESIKVMIALHTAAVPEAVSREIEVSRGQLAGRRIKQVKQPWTQLTYDQFMGLKDAIDNIMGVGRNARMMTIDGQKVDRDAVILELANEMAQMTPARVSDGMNKAQDWKDNGMLQILTMGAGMRRVEQWVQTMDGKFGGPFRKYIWNPINDARNTYQAARKDVMKQLTDILRQHADRLNDGIKIDVPEINYEFRDKSELISMLVHTGNPSNFDKLVRGRKWGEDQTNAAIQRMMSDGTITKEDMDLVQSLWDLVDGLRPAAQKAHKQMYGYNFSEVTKWPVETPFGEYQGGYWPAIIQPNLTVNKPTNTTVDDVINQDESGMFPTTGRGFTKSRVQAYAEPLMMDLKTLPMHVDKVLRFIHIEPAVKDVAKLVMNRNFAEAIKSVDPAAVESMLVPWLKRSARQSVEQSGGIFAAGAGFSRFLRRSVSAQTMMLNILNAMQQVTGFFPVIYKVGPRPFARAFTQYIKNPRKAHEHIYALSPFMATRNTTLAENMEKEAARIILGHNKFVKVRDAAVQHGYIFQRIFQSWVDNTAWMAAYDSAISEGKDTKEAVRIADFTVRATQGSTAAEDVSSVEASNAFGRLFTMFYSYFNGQANFISTEAQQLLRDTSGLKLTGNMFYLYMMAYAMPALLAEFIVRSFKGDLPDDEDEDGTVLDDYLKWIGLSQARYGAAMVPFAGQFINAGLAKFDDMPWNDGISISPVVGLGETAIRSVFTVPDAVFDDGDGSRAVRDGLTSLGFMTGLPLGQLGKPLGYFADVAEGDQDIESPLDAVRGIIAGPAIQK